MLKYFKVMVKLFRFPKLRCFAIIILLALGLSCYGQQEALSSNLRLVMFTSKDCPACQAWEREIGSIYKKSQYQVTFPLTRLNFSTPRPEWLSIKEPISGTPTFVIIENGHEVGRILGFTGPEMFWWQLSSFSE